MNSRLDALQAAVLRVKLRHFKDELKKRSENASKYNDFFCTVPGITPQKIASGNTSTYAQYTVQADERDDFIAQLERAEIPYCIHYPQPLHTQPCFKGLNQGLGNANAIEACQKVVSLPMCAFTDVDEIVEKLQLSLTNSKQTSR